MNGERYRLIEDWTEDDLSSLPSAEDDLFEFKSGRIKPDELKKKLAVSASAYWNSGGGYLVVGVDTKGRVDGGIPEGAFGKQSIGDWVDQAVGQVEPPGPYKTRVIHREKEDSAIEGGKIVLIIAFEQSPNAPHMATDRKYYIRAGAHSAPAGHFLVEAIRARRIHRPVLKGVLERGDYKLGARLAIVSLTDISALDVRIWFEPLPSFFHDAYKDDYPVIVPLIERRAPYIMHLHLKESLDDLIGQTIQLYFTYSDLLGREYRESENLRIDARLDRMQFEQISQSELRRVLQDISRNISNIERAIKNKRK